MHYDACYAAFVVKKETQHALSIAPDHFGFRFDYFHQKSKYSLCEGLSIQHGWHFYRSCLFKPLPGFSANQGGDAVNVLANDLDEERTG